MPINGFPSTSVSFIKICYAKCVHIFRCVFQSGLSLGGADGLVHGVTLSSDEGVSIVTTENGDMIQIMSDTDVSDAIDQETVDPSSIV